MPRNKRGGNKAKSKANRSEKLDKRALRIKEKDRYVIDPKTKKEVLIKSDELYGMVERRTGGRPPVLIVKTEDKKVRTCHIRGKMIKKVWCNAQDIVLIKYDITKNNDSTGNVEHKYENKEIRQLEKLKELDRNQFVENIEDKELYNSIVFNYDSEDEKEEKDKERKKKRNEDNVYIDFKAMGLDSTSEDEGIDVDEI